jgi:hypothetical protein
MPCNCGKKATQKFVYVAADGKQVEYPTEIQAKAAQIRAGGGGFVKAV